jgi:CRP-like cAMP-binding protein
MSSSAPPVGAADALARTPFFAHLSAVDLARLVPQLEQRHYDAGEVVFSQGDPPDGLYVIQDGTADVFIRQPDGDETVLASLRPPEYFGEMALVSDEARSATVRATRDLDI